MFKKTLAAAALLGAFAGSAVAADVTLYGVVDYGLQYTHVDSDKAGTDAVDNFRSLRAISPALVLASKVQKISATA